MAILALCSIRGVAQDSLAIGIETQDSLQTIPALTDSTRVRLDSLIAATPLLRTTQLGMMVYDLTADSTIYAIGEKQTLRPASTMKVLTAITALDRLGADYRYTTSLRYTGEITDTTGVLQGDIYIIGGMDPMLTMDDLRAFADSIKVMGIDTICGNIYADRSMKDANLLGEGWCWDDDNPVLSPLVIGRKDNLLQRFVDCLAKAGIALNGNTEERSCPKGAITICQRQHTITQVMRRMMKDSDNLYAESMLYQVGMTQGKPSTAKKAHRVTKALMKKMGIDNAPCRLADGSGLSLYNYISAEILVAFLRYAHNNDSISPYITAAMPLAGVDGTLEKRMVGTTAEANVRAKTGTLSGISSLAGYCTAPNGNRLAFAIINQGSMSAAPAKAFQDKVCIILTNNTTEK